MIEKILEYSGYIFAAFGVICLVLESYAAFKRKDRSKLTIAGLVFLSISVVGFIVTEIILINVKVSYWFSVAWIVMIWAYIACNVVAILIKSRQRRLAKRNRQNESDVTATDEDDTDE